MLKVNKPKNLDSFDLEWDIITMKNYHNQLSRVINTRNEVGEINHYEKTEKLMNEVKRVGAWIKEKMGILNILQTVKNN